MIILTFYIIFAIINIIICLILAYIEYNNGEAITLENICVSFGVPYSPDDERPGSKTIVLVEHGTIQEVKNAILQNPFLLDKFKKVKEKRVLHKM